MQHELGAYLLEQVEACNVDTKLTEFCNDPWQTVLNPWQVKSDPKMWLKFSETIGFPPEFFCG